MWCICTHRGGPRADGLGRTLGTTTTGRAKSPGPFFVKASLSFNHPGFMPARTVSVQSRTARVRLELPNRDLAIMYAQVLLSSRPIPSDRGRAGHNSVIQPGERALVLVETDDSTFLPREVPIGRTSGRYMQIIGGLSEGQRVVASAAFLRRGVELRRNDRRDGARHDRRDGRGRRHCHAERTRLPESREEIFTGPSTNVHARRRNLAWS